MYSPILSLRNGLWYVVPLIPEIHSYPPDRSHLHPPSRSFSSTTLPSLQHTKLTHPSLSPCHDHELTPSMVYTEYSIPRSTAYTVYTHTWCTAYPEYSMHRVQHTPKIVCFPFNFMITSWPLDLGLDSGVPPYIWSSTISQAFHPISNVPWPCHIPTVAS